MTGHIEISAYFDSSLPHAVSAVSESVNILAAIYNGDTMLQLTRGRHMRDIIQAAKLIGGKSIPVVCPDQTSMGAVNKGIEEGIINHAYLIGDIKHLPSNCLRYRRDYELLEIDPDVRNYE